MAKYTKLKSKVGMARGPVLYRVNLLGYYYYYYRYTVVLSAFDCELLDSER